MPNIDEEIVDAREARRRRREDVSESPPKPVRTSRGRDKYAVVDEIRKEIVEEDDGDDPFEETRRKTLKDTESDYHKRRYDRPAPSVVSDPFSKRPSKKAKSYKDLMKERQVERDEMDVKYEIKRKEEEESLDKRRGVDNSSKWDMTPQMLTMKTPLALLTPEQMSKMTREEYASLKAQQEEEFRTKYFTDAELDALLPSKGYEIVPPPEGYVSSVKPVEQVIEGFHIPKETTIQQYNIPLNDSEDADLPFLSPEDFTYFGALLQVKEEDVKDADTRRRREVMRLLIQIKNGSPPVRKIALKWLTDQARVFGASALFDQLLPLLMSPTLEATDRHLLVKVVGRLLHKLDDLVRPHVHRILVVVEPLLIDEDFFARAEGREIISSLAKAVGFPSMVAALRPDIDSADEYVRNTTSRAFAVVAAALGVATVLPFLKALCKSQKSWRARHSGCRIVRQICLLIGCAILPHLHRLIEVTKEALEDPMGKVRGEAALAIAALAEASHPFGGESFDCVLRPVWSGIDRLRGKVLGSFLKAAGFIIPLFDAKYARFYTEHIIKTVVREFASPDEEMRRTVLRIVEQILSAEGIDSDFVRERISSEFFNAFWVRRTALEKRSKKLVINATHAIACKIGGGTVVVRIVGFLKDASEPFRHMTCETIAKILGEQGSDDLNDELVALLIDGLLSDFSESNANDSSHLIAAFGATLYSLGKRCHEYLPRICGTIKWRLNDRDPLVRMSAANLIPKVSTALAECNETALLGHLGLVLYEFLGEAYPDVLASVIFALKAVVDAIGMEQMSPPIKDLLPRLTPILKNRHELVQQRCIELVGRIADKGAEFVAPQEWMRICFELLDTLKAPRKSVRRAAVAAFGFIARAIGPPDVLSTLLNNLKVQERQLRLCTTIAIAVVAETCAPFTVIPALMNEYRMPDKNVQNGVLKSFSFLFEYIGEAGKDYLYTVLPLLEDALMDRDAVHRQTACAAVKHITLGVVGMGCEDALIHLLNYVFPNIFETSPHVINAVTDALEAFRVALGPAFIMSYIVQGLFHPARKVRSVCWKVYNNLYIGSQDALVAAYPKVAYDGLNGYERWETEYFL